MDSPPQLKLKGRKLFDEELGRRARVNSHTGGGNKRKMLKSSALILISLSMLHMFYWRTPLLTYISETKVSKEEEVDAWNLLQKDVEILRRREATRKAERREHNKGNMQRNRRRPFAPIPKLVRTPLDLPALPGQDSSTQFKSAHIIQLDGESKYLQPKQKKLQPWVFANTTTVDESEDDSDLTRSQTVVYDNDRECVPMAEWQTTFHVRSFNV